MGVCIHTQTSHVYQINSGGYGHQFTHISVTLLTDYALVDLNASKIDQGLIG